MATRVQVSGWTEMADPPNLTSQQWNLTGLLGVVLIVMAILQLIGFSDFKDWIDSIGLSGPAVWAVVIIIAEVAAAVGFFKLRLSFGLRMLSAWLAILVSGFWFVENLRLVSEGKAGHVANSGFFGKYLHQSPSWWTVIEVTVLLFWVVYSLELTKASWSKD